MKLPLSLLRVFCLWFASVASAEEIVLFEPSDAKTPIDAGFFGFSSDVFNQGNFHVGKASFTAFDSSASTLLRAGYLSHGGITGNQIHPAVPDLSSERGFRLHWEMAIAEEHHESEDVAGFTVLVLDRHGRGINLGFWKDRVWASEGGEAPLLFTQAEHAELTDSADLAPYSITILEDNYVLSRDGVDLVSGSLRDYTAWPGIAIPIAGTYDPYEVPNMIFFGDDTPNAHAVVQLGRICLEPALQSSPHPAQEVQIVRGPGDLIKLTWAAPPNQRLQLQISEDLRAWREDAVVETDDHGSGELLFQPSGTIFVRFVGL